MPAPTKKHINVFLRQVSNMGLYRCLKDALGQLLYPPDPRRVVLGTGLTDLCSEGDADVNFWQLFLENSSDGGSSNCGFYLDMFLTGSNSGGHALRGAMNVQDTVGTVVTGVLGELKFGDTGRVSAFGAAIRGVLHIANQSTQTGNITAIAAEFDSDGPLSDPQGAVVSLFRVANGGNSAGAARVDDDAFMFLLEGFTAGASHMFATGLNAATVSGNLTAALRMRVGNTTYYIPVATAIS